MPVIAIVSQKGGVGKTSLATNLASALAEEESTRLLGCDPQCSEVDPIGWTGLSHN